MVIQNPMKVKYIKLLNAEELVAKVVEETDTILEINQKIFGSGIVMPNVQLNG